jgi:hypothetical protein
MESFIGEPTTRRAAKELLQRASGEVLIPGTFIENLRQEGLLISLVLAELVAEGYVLHGTETLVAYLRPSPGDDDQLASKQQAGVYATIIPDIALFKATVSPRLLQKGHPSYTIGWHTFGVGVNIEPGAHFYGSVALDQARRKGYIYVLAEGDFTRIDAGEYIATKEVSPVLIVPVEPNDFSGDYTTESMA